MNGEYRNTIDEKGRLMIPPKLREQLGTSELMLTKSMDDTLWLFTKEEFAKLDATLNSNPLSLFDPNIRAIDMVIISPARDVELDKTGRLSIPQVLRDYAGLNVKDECVILGSKTHIEIMSVSKNDVMMKELKAKLAQAGSLLSAQLRGV